MHLGDKIARTQKATQAKNQNRLDNSIFGDFYVYLSHESTMN